ncbi:uncharacterized protein LOC108664311 [Hyalella azteca]|uniref:Uncharacterized protein LOC108664311 n=1 Tax=Hyalella azteca TaxID=294128 RepID=A0A8B7MYM7_HYAAZ|nr:uncharacterized protein LOC108664311 [Hyalella azteca]
MLELVWLYHGQQAPVKAEKMEELLAGALSVQDSRLAPLVTAMTVEIKGMKFVKIYNLVREVPVSRHRYFLSNLLLSIYSPASSNNNNNESVPVVMGVGLSVLQNMIKVLSDECCACRDSTRGEGTMSVNGEANCCTGRQVDLNHREKVSVLFQKIMSYIQFTGAIHVVRRATIESLKRKKLSANHDRRGNSLSENDCSFGSRSSSCSSDCQDPPQLADEIFYDVYGRALAKDYLTACTARFSSDRKMMTGKQRTFSELLECCEHIFMLKMPLVLLYFKI